MMKTEPAWPPIEPELIRRAAEIIRQGGLVAFPTETVYGLGANALDPAAVRKIFEVKGRPPSSPLIVHVDSPEMARSLASTWLESAELLARRFWPGPLTLILPKRPTVPDEVTAGLPTVGIRVPDHPIALALIRAAGCPIAAPSANRFTQLSPTTAEHVRAALGHRIDLILDGGPTRVGIESTVLSLAVQPPVIYRPGMITKPQIEAVIGPVTLAPRLENGPSAGHPSPGLHPRHYSPTTPLFLLSTPDELPTGRGVWLYWKTPADRATLSLPMPADAFAYAAALYETLHRLDRQGWDWISVERPPSGPEWAAILDRLERAASAHSTSPPAAPSNPR